MKKKILVFCSYGRDIRELSSLQIQNNYEIIFEKSSSTWLKQLCALPNSQDIGYYVESAIDKVCEFVINNDIDAIISSWDYPANVFRVAINEKLKKTGPRLKNILRCEHKYYSRLDQLKYVAEAVPYFILIESSSTKNIKFPLIVKPVKSNLGRNAFVANSKKNFLPILKTVPLPASFLAPFNYFLKKHQSLEYDACNIIAEDFLQGYQTTVEGFVRNGEVTILGVIDALMFPNTISFLRFEYPSSLDKNVQQRMSIIAKQAIRGSELDNTLFNVECIYNPEMDQIFIVEINPRISSQFADLFERVDGFNTYEIMIDLALSNEPVFMQRKGPFNIAASCVLRFFEDKLVEKIPSQANIKKVKELFPDMNIELYAQPGKKLSDERQDSKSFRYGLIHLGAYDREDLLNRFEICKQLLDFRFKPIR